MPKENCKCKDCKCNTQDVTAVKPQEALTVVPNTRNMLPATLYRNEEWINFRIMREALRAKGCRL